MHAHVPLQLHRQFQLGLADLQLILEWDGESRENAWSGIVVVGNPDCTVQPDFSDESIGEIEKVFADF